MFVIDTRQFRKAIRESGYRSITELARRLKIHRNTINYYLASNRVLPEKFEKMIEALDLHPSEILVEKQDPTKTPFSLIAPVVDELHQRFPEITFVLFGSRAGGRPHKYSDWDIGIYSRKGVPHPTYEEILRCADDLAEELPYMIQVVNFNKATTSFLKEASSQWKFLTGSQQDWLELQRKATYKQS
jgi:predicted nucleotidyltransferase